MNITDTVPAHPLVVGEPVSGLSLETLNGKKLTLLHLQGPHGTVMIFFSTLCACSRKSVARLSTFVETCRSQGIQVYGVAIGESRNRVRRYAADLRLDYPILFDPGGRITDDYGITTTPTLVGINAGGVVRYLDPRLPPDADTFVRRLTAPGSGTGDGASAGRGTILTRTELLDLTRSGKPVTIVDVRMPKDFQRAHIRGAINIPLTQIVNLHDRIDREGTVVTLGAGPVSESSTHAAERLVALGFPDVRDFQGGLTDWMMAGLPVETGDPVCFVTRDELLTMWRLRPELVLLDVRSPAAYARGHIARAVNIPAEDVVWRAAPLDKSLTIVVYCDSFVSRDSTSAAHKLAAMGFKAVHDYKGGIQEWKDGGLPVIGAEQTPSAPSEGGADPSLNSEDYSDTDISFT